MREILFRGKRLDNGEWVEGSLIKTGGYCCILPDDDGTNYDYPYLDAVLGTIDGYATPVAPSTVGQYTGLKDKNGKRIFEGDVVVISQFGLTLSGIVEFHDCGFEVYSKELDAYECLWYECSELEVIGNIHDNPELPEPPEGD